MDILKKLIINADDFGLTKGCSKGIIDAMKNGIVTSTTVMINMPYAQKAIELAKENGIKKIGLHLTLTCGKPINETSKVSTIVDENGMFYRRKEKPFQIINLEDVKREFSSQIEEFYKNKIDLTHLDSHHHVHMYEDIREIAVDLAAKYGVPLRAPNAETKKLAEEKKVYTTDFFSMDFYSDNATLEGFKKIIEDCPEGTIEIMTHPGYLDEELMNISSYNVYRQKELEILTNKDAIEWIKSKGIKLIDFTELRD